MEKSEWKWEKYYKNACSHEKAHLPRPQGDTLHKHKKSDEEN